MITFYAKESHFEDHLAPVYNKLQDAGYEVEWVRDKEESSFSGGFAVVASSGDLERATKAKKMVMYMEHGSGQSYTTRHSSYAGGSGRDNVALFLDPGPHVAIANKKSYPHIPSVPVGVPKLDNFHLLMKQEPAEVKSKPVVCFSFHWDCLVCPETRNGFEYFKSAILALKGTEEYEVIGHCHPRARKEVLPFYKKHNIPFVENFREVLKRADIYVCDNSSTIFEFVSIGKPVVLLNPPHYRKFVNHGLRFWQFSDVGPNAFSISDVLEGVRNVSVDTKEKKAHRLSRIKQVYYAMDGKAAERAASAICNFIEELDKMKKSGNMLRCKRFAMGLFGMMDPGYTATVYEDHAIVHNTKGQLIRNIKLPGKKSPEERIKEVLHKSGKNYESVDFEYDEEDEVDPLDVDYIEEAQDFVPVDKSVSVEELYVLQKVQEGESKTPIIHRSEKFRMTDLQKAWDKLEGEGAIEKDPDSKHGWRLTNGRN